ncbi:MAG: UDP-N-acetylglucosamine 1-carboxyvinyltransferase, partial [Nitrospinaceae bacterium]|nr:UDP-N-acetylglucosamine 1-carboxyvinyltransferase [Nitrospinaceae bacterium]
MDKIVIQGGIPLQGQVTVSGAKNAVLPVLAASLLTSGTNDIRNVPRVRDVATMVHLLRELGADIESYEADRIVLDTTSINNHEAPYD